MTVAIVVKIWDGIALAADSATTLRLDDGSSQVYNSANKIFHLHRELPIGAMTWGLGSIGPASIATLTKDLRARLMGRDAAHKDWELDPDTYTVEGVANRLVEHLHGELFSQVFGTHNPPPGGLGMLVAGYSAGEQSAEGWVVEISDPAVTPLPTLTIPRDGAGWVSFAQPAATQRLWFGVDQELVGQLEAALDPPEWQKIQPVIQAYANGTSPVWAGMPLQDAINLAQFMVDATAGFTHFLLGPNTVGGPTEVASISRHEGFKWIHRKHYYDPSINPRETGHAS